MDKLSLNDSKTKVIVFGESSGSFTVDLGSLNNCMKPHVTILRVTVESEL